MIDIKNPLRSLNICAASERIANDPLSNPPMTSAIKKSNAIPDATNSLHSTPFETYETSGKS